MPMMRIVMRKVYFRPTRSPSRPNTSAPNGRTAKPAAKASSAKMNAAVGFDAGEELLADDRRERAVEVEVVPLEHGAERRREDHAPDVGGAELTGARTARVVGVAAVSSCSPEGYGGGCSGQDRTAYATSSASSITSRSACARLIPAGPQDRMHLLHRHSPSRAAHVMSDIDVLLQEHRKFEPSPAFRAAGAA